MSIQLLGREEPRNNIEENKEHVHTYNEVKTYFAYILLDIINNETTTVLRMETSGKKEYQNKWPNKIKLLKHPLKF